MGSSTASSPAFSCCSVASGLAPFIAIICFIVASLALHFEQERYIFVSITSVGYVLSLFGLFGLVATSEWNKETKSHETDVKFMMKCAFVLILSVLFFSTVMIHDAYVQGLLIVGMIMFVFFYVGFVWYFDMKFEQKCLDRLKFKSATISVINKNFADDKRPLVVKEDKDIFNV